jgi:hypothetical protein
MNLNTSAESPTISMEQPSAPLNLTITESPALIVSQSERTTLPLTLSPILPIGERESNQILMPSVNHSPPKSETSSANPLLNLKSRVKPHALLERPAEPRILKVSKEDVEALGQVIAEFEEQIAGF